MTLTSLLTALGDQLGDTVGDLAYELADVLVTFIAGSLEPERFPEVDLASNREGDGEKGYKSEPLRRGDAPPLRDRKMCRQPRRRHTPAVHSMTT